jgi:hypothetical protein
MAKEPLIKEPDIVKTIEFSPTYYSKEAISKAVADFKDYNAKQKSDHVVTIIGSELLCKEFNNYVLSMMKEE